MFEVGIDIVGEEGLKQDLGCCSYSAAGGPNAVVHSLSYRYRVTARALVIVLIIVVVVASCRATKDRRFLAFAEGICRWVCGTKAEELAARASMFCSVTNRFEGLIRKVGRPYVCRSPDWARGGEKVEVEAWGFDVGERASSLVTVAESVNNACRPSKPFKAAGTVPVPRGWVTVKLMYVVSTEVTVRLVVVTVESQDPPKPICVIKGNETWRGVTCIGWSGGRRDRCHAVTAREKHGWRGGGERVGQ